MSRKHQVDNLPGPAEQSYLKVASTRIGVLVAVVCAAMVFLGAALLLGYLWLRSSPLDAAHAKEFRINVSIDPVDFAIAGVLLGIFAVVVAGVTAVWFSRRAVEPLAEAYAKQRTFVADASHELRTPLAVLSARTQQLSLLSRNDASLSPISDALKEDVSVMVDIVDDLLATASFDTDPQPGELHQALNSAVDKLQLLAQRNANSISVNVAPELPNPTYLSVPAVQLQRIVVALIDNALGYSPRGADVAVSASPSTATSSTTAPFRSVSARTVSIRVTDHGPGITGIAADRVFERFATGSQPSSRQSHGIGLALVADIAHKYGGSARVERTGPDGTVFVLNIPIADPAAASPASSTSPTRGELP